MLQIDLENLIQNIFKKDIIDNGKITNKSQMSTITIKSLLPDENRFGNIIDYKRFKEELRLWRCYRVTKDKEFDILLEDENNWDYFKFKDDYLVYRILPIIVGNRDYNIIEREVIKNILFTTGNLKELWTWIFNMRFIYSLLNGTPDIIEDLKSYIINFSQVDYLSEYEKFYRFPLKDYPGVFQVEFEREKINILNVSNGIGLKGYEKVEDLLCLPEKENIKTDLGKIIYYSFKNNGLEVDLPDFYRNLNLYLLKLRKNQINSEDLQIVKYNLPDIFSYKEGDVFFHSLLNDSKVIKKEVRNNILTSLVQTKSGMYLFKRDSI